MSGIRVTYSGLISLAVGLISIVTGIIFTLIVTRTLTPKEFGTWNLIGGLIIYVIIIEPTVSYWITREIARGENSGRTATVASGVLSAGASTIYFIIAYWVSFSLDVDRNILLFSTILIPSMFLNRTLTSINLGWKPQAISYGTLCFEITKIPAGLILVYFLHTGIYGAILSSFIAYIGSIIVLMIYAKDKIKDRIKISYLKKWIRLSWLSIYPGIYNIIWHLDVIIFSSITGSVVGLAYLSVSMTVANLSTNAGQISQALYPKILAQESKREQIQENITRFTYFAFPLCAITIVFARPALFALNPVYEIATPVVIFLMIRGFLYTAGGIYAQILLGIERVDINEKSTFRDYVRSKLFFIPTINLFQNIAYVTILAVGLILLKITTTDTMNFVKYWSIVFLVMQIPLTSYYYFSARKHFGFTTNIKVLIKYLIATTIAFGATYLLVEKFLHYNRSIIIFIPNVLLYVVFGITLYLAITYLIDSKTRKLFYAIIDELKQK